MAFQAVATARAEAPDGRWTWPAVLSAWSLRRNVVGHGREQDAEPERERT